MRAWLVWLQFGVSLLGQQQPKLILPDETAGFDAIVQTLVAAFDHIDIVALGENHWSKMDSDLRIALVRNREFTKKVRFIVVEFGSTAQQATLDRYIRGEDVQLAELQQVWKTTTQTSGIWDSPVYADFYAAVREVNKKLPAAAQVRVLAGDPPTGSGLGRDASAFAILEEQVLKTHGKALVIYGAGHLLRAKVGPVARITQRLETGYPGQTLVVITEGGPHAEYQEFERALKTRERPVLVSLGKSPFRDLLVGAFPGLGITLGQIADACVYFGMGPEADVVVRPDR
jgi:uncharacterized iron-regulated protein